MDPWYGCPRYLLPVGKPHKPRGGWRYRFLAIASRAATVSCAERPVMRMSFRRDLCPETMVTQDCDKRNARARKQTQARLALPWLGGA